MGLAEETQWLDGLALAELVASGDVAPAEMVEAACQRIEALDGPLNAVVLRWFDEAISVASKPDLPDGPFRGVPFLLKDLWAESADHPLTNGNRALRDKPVIGVQDTELVARFKQSGLVIAGRTSSPEFGSLPVTEPIAYGPTRNPWDVERSPGGSSGGAAAAVASGMLPIAHATDGGGSIRIPSSCTGLVGLKVSQGRISMGPTRAEHERGVELCVSRTVRDTAAMLDATAGPGVGDTIRQPPPERPYLETCSVDPAPLRVGVLDHHPRGGQIHRDCATAARTAATLLEELGHSVQEAWPKPLEDQHTFTQFMSIWATDRALNLAQLSQQLGRPVTEEDVEPINWAQAQRSEDFTSVQLATAQAAVLPFRRAMHQWWHSGWDLLLTPTLGEPPPFIGEHQATADDPMAGMKRAQPFTPFTPAISMAGLPAISVPLHWNDEGLPIGIQLVAAYGREDILLSVAGQLERARPWAHRRPPSKTG